MTDWEDDRTYVAATAPSSGLDANGQRSVGDDERITYAARALAAQFWRGGSDEQYHFLLYLCGHAVRIVQSATDQYDTLTRDPS